MPQIRTRDGVSLFVQDWGTDRPVVLIHGWPLSAEMWEYQAGELVANGFRVISYDRRGFGRSDRPWDGYDYDTLADDLADLLDALDLRDAALVGFSMGGGEVVRYLARHGTARVSRAVLVSAVVPALRRTSEHPEGVDPAVFDAMITGLDEDRPAFLSGFARRVFGIGLLSSPVSPEFLDWMHGLAMQGSRRATLQCVHAFAGTDFHRDLPAVTVPTLVIHGDADATVPIEPTARRAAALLPDARLIEYPGAPHGLFATARERLAADLVAFLAG